MTARVVLACDGQEGVYPCRQATPVGAVPGGREARLIAQSQGWSVRYVGEGSFHDLCPRCTRQAAR